MKKGGAALCALLMLLCACAGRAEQEIGYENPLYGVLESTDGVSDVNLREEPSMDAALAGIYHSGVSAQAVGREDGWLYVEVGSDSVGSRYGYVLEKYFTTDYQADHESGFPVMRVLEEQTDFASEPRERTSEPAHRKGDGSLELGTGSWPQLAAGTLCVALGEAEDGAWTHVQIGFDQVGFVRTAALEATGLSSLNGGKLPRSGLAAAHPGTEYAMPVYRYAADTEALWPTLREGDMLEYIAVLGEWVQVSVANYMECAFVPAKYLTLYPYDELLAVTDTFTEGTHTIDSPGLYTFSCVGSGRLEIATSGGARVYEGSGMYSMYLPVGAQVTVTDGILSGISRDVKIENLSQNGVGAWDESHGSGRYLAGVQLEADLWKEESYIVTVADGCECGYYRIETIDQDAGVAPPGEWIALAPDDVAAVSLYHGQFIELRDATLSYFSGNG